MGLVAPQNVGSSWAKGRTHVPGIGRQILNHWTLEKSCTCVFIDELLLLGELLVIGLLENDKVVHDQDLIYDFGVRVLN